MAVCIPIPPVADATDNAPAPAAFGLSYSTARTRTPADDLAGAYVVGKVYIFVDPLFPAGFEDYDKVLFYLDGKPMRTEYAAPYDFAGGGTALANSSWDSRTVEDGEHTITVKAMRTGAVPLVTSVTFNVSNDTPPPPKPPEPPPEPVRFATYNASLNRFNEGDLVADLSTPQRAGEGDCRGHPADPPRGAAAERVRLRRRR